MEEQMALQLTDLDELCQMVRNSNSKTYLKEAITSYRAGAYRAAVTLTWIAVCVDIVEKIRELSLGNDAPARAIEVRLNGILPTDVVGMLAFERQVLDIACNELELISPIEKAHLERLKDDRNVCAHPTFSTDGTQFSPLPEVARAYIVQAASFLLINPPMKGKVVVDRLFHLVNEESFPVDDENAFAVLSSDKFLGRVKDSSVKNFGIILLKRLFRDATVLSDDALNRLCSALGAISRMKPEIYADVLTSKLSQMLAETNDELLKRVFPFLFRRIETWRYIEGALVIRLQGLIRALNVTELISFKLSALASMNPTIDTPFQARVEQLEDADLRVLVGGSPSKALRKKAVRVFTGSGSFASAYSNGSKYLLPHAAYLYDEDLRELLTGSRNNRRFRINQILEAGGIEEIFCQTYLDSKNLAASHSQIWKEFWDAVSEEGYRFHELQGLLIEDGVIPAPAAPEAPEEQ